MKKIIALILSVSLCFSLVACVKNQDVGDELTTEANEAIVTTVAEETDALIDVELSNEQEDQGEGEILPRKYRDNFYSIPGYFVDIVGKETYREWNIEYLDKNYPDDTKEMHMVAYIKAFNISREDFDRANIKYAKWINEIHSDDTTQSVTCLEPQDYADQEMQEIYNADIIYTFDNEIISEYYLGIDYPFLNEGPYLEALEAGTYETRTTKFITVDQMEAEFVEKYGHPSQMTEIETVITEVIEEVSKAAEALS